MKRPQNLTDNERENDRKHKMATRVLVYKKKKYWMRVNKKFLSFPNDPQDIF